MAELGGNGDLGGFQHRGLIDPSLIVFYNIRLGKIYFEALVGSIYFYFEGGHF